jgi:hypothetical protein
MLLTAICTASPANANWWKNCACILAWSWFTGLGFDQDIPHHSRFSKNRHGRFQESKLFEQLFEQIVVRCLQAGLVRRDELSVDSTFVEANAAKESRIPREKLAEAAQVHRTVRQYLKEVEAESGGRTGPSAKADRILIPPTPPRVELARG